MTIPPTYRKSSEFIASFNFLDIAARTGYGIFYLAQSNSTEYFMTTDNNVKSSATDTVLVENFDAPFTDDAKTFDFDMDLEFNVPQNLRGKIIANIAIAARRSGGTGHEQFVKARPYHVTVGGTETALASQVTGLRTTDSGVQLGFTHSLTMDIEQTHFKVGEKLRIKLEHWVRDFSAVASTWNVGIGNDPAARASNQDNIFGSPISLPFTSTDSTRTTLLIPFRIDI